MYISFAWVGTFTMSVSARGAVVKQPLYEYKRWSMRDGGWGVFGLYDELGAPVYGSAGGLITDFDSGAAMAAVNGHALDGWRLLSYHMKHGIVLERLRR